VAIDAALQDREVSADALHVDRRSLGNPEHGKIIPFWSELARKG
jgi:hypothetical protein